MAIGSPVRTVYLQQTGLFSIVHCDAGSAVQHSDMVAAAAPSAEIKVAALHEGTITVGRTLISID